MSRKETLVTTAILGTGQHPDLEIDCNGVLADYVLRLRSDDRKLSKEKMLLHVTALICAHEKAGQKWRKFDATLPAPSQAEDRENVSASARSILKLLIEAHTDLLPEWMELVSRSGKRIPDDLLCDLLDLAVREPVLQSKMKGCAGKRALWLASFNPAWSFASAFTTVAEPEFAELKKDWDFGSPEQRIAALSSLRKTDPSKGLQLLRSTWSDDSAEDRTRFLTCLSQGLSMEDEEFLETEVLDDRRKEVRKKAQDLLLKLPESRLVNRAWQRVLECVELKPMEGNFLSKLMPGRKPAKELVVSLPESCDKAMIRDGISAKSNYPMLGERAWILCQLISYVQPARLLNHFQLSAADLLDAGGEQMLAVRKGLEEASILHSDPVVAKELMQRAAPDNWTGLFQVLSDADKESVLSRILEINGFLIAKQENNYTQPYTGMLLKMSHNWSPDFSRVILKSVRTHLTQKNPHIFYKNIMRHIGKHMDTGVWLGVRDTWVSMGPDLDEMISVLALRIDMQQSLSQ